MELKKYLSNKTPEEVEAIAKKAETSALYLYHLCQGYRNPGTKMLRLLPLATDNQVTIDDLLKMSDRSNQ